MTDWPLSPSLQAYLNVQYELRRVLGEGGMGVVLLANERVLDRLVAIKTLRRHASEDPELRKRFRREARLAAQLQHPNIVPLHTFGEVDGEMFFVMGYVEGETLAERLHRGGTIPSAEALRILREVCDALGMAHERGIIHRDVKPENVLLEARTGRALLADFGIAREDASTSALTGTGVALGTPHYMSPEQVAPGSPVDHRADIYSVGVLGYRLLSGRLPFDSTNVRDLLAQQVSARPRSLALAAPAASPRAAAAIMRSLEKDPDARWPDAASLRTALGVEDGEEDLPEELIGIDGIGTTMTAVSAIAAGAWVLNRFGWRNDLLADLLPMAIAAPALGAVLVATLMGFRHGFRRVFPIALRPPRYWPLWWPRFARRPGDVWDRLPRMVRWARWLMWGASGVLTMLGIPLVLMIVTTPMDRLNEFFMNPYVLRGLPITIYLAASGLLGSGVLMYAWWRRVGGGSMMIARPPWIGEPVASPRWKRAELERYLLPAELARNNAPDSPVELGEAISERVRALIGTGVIPSPEASDVARDVVDAIAAIDLELAMLVKGGDTVELKRVEARLAGVAPGGLTRDVAEILTRQRDALREMVRRRETQQMRRERLLHRLRELFLALDVVRDHAAAADGTSLSGRVQVVCDDLRRLAAGYDDVRDSAPPPLN
ncbi:MAG: serine/threonine-protein kinase [Gemmatimonadetes bacterium]|nr:serine/threonine-protein kinase [Gemmatimonadota bacterium]